MRSAPPPWARVVGSCLAPCLLALLLAPAAACAGKASAGAKTVAVAAWVVGEVTLTRRGETRPLRVGEALRPEDHVRTAVASFAVLRLGNGFLVRVDEEVDLRVGSIALLGTHRTPPPVDAQLRAILYPEEVAVMPRLREGVERVAGWRAGMRSIETVPASEARSAEPAVQEEAPRAAPAPTKSLGGFGGGSARDEAVERRARRHRSPQPAPSRSGGGGASRSPTPPAVEGETRQTEAREKKKRASEAPAAPAESSPPMTRAPAPGPAPRTEAPLGPRALSTDLDLRRCLFDAWPEAGPTLHLYLKITQGKIVRLRLSGARPLPACARARLLRRPWVDPAPSGWVEVRLAKP